MLPKQERLINSSEFRYIYRQKKSVANSLLILYTGKKQLEKSHLPKAGFVVSKNIHKRAVKRNRIKRLMRESYRLIRMKSDIPKSWNSLIFLPRTQALEADFEQVYNAMEHCLKLAEKKYG